jgi:hypothetical protein
MTFGCKTLARLLQHLLGFILMYLAARLDLFCAPLLLHFLISGFGSLALIICFWFAYPYEDCKVLS